MALNFPNSPTTGQSYSQGDRTWIYNGYGWALQGIRSGSFFSRTYTGNGTANAFVVTTGVTSNSVIVTENGVVQQPIADYSVTGTVLTFTTAPADNVKITIHELGYPDDQTYVNVGANIVPSTTETYDLGSADKKWKDLYLSGNTIFLGNTTISASNNDLVLPANTKVGNTNTSLPAGGAFSFRNKIINGNFDIWQRGGSQTSSGYGSADRWQCLHANSPKTASRQAFDLGQTDVPNNPKYFMRHVVTSVAGSGNFVLMTQKIEGVETLSGKTATLTFWAKADASKNIAVEFLQWFGTGGSPSTAVSEIGSQLVALTTSWTKYTITVDIPSVSGKTLGSNSNDYIQVVFWFDAGSDYDSRTASLGQQSGTFDITQVQIEEGTAATPFEQRPIGMELSLCQRYYEQNPVSNHVIWSVYAASGSTYYRGFQFTVVKRAAPTMTLGDISNSRFPNTITTSGGGLTRWGFRADATANATGVGFIRFAWYADAEI